MIAEQQQENQDWYNRSYNEDATQRADAQRMLQRTEEIIKNRNRQAAGTQAVMGGTEESVAAAKAANSQALADATSQIAASADARKDAIEQQYLQRKDANDAARRQLQGQKMSGWDIAGSAVGGAADALSGMF